MKCLIFLTTHLADTLKDGYGMLEVADVKHWNNQFDVGIVANAIDR
jgi:methyl coenzyme M reductase beta subunit